MNYASGLALYSSTCCEENGYLILKVILLIWCEPCKLMALLISLWIVQVYFQKAIRFFWTVNFSRMKNGFCSFFCSKMSFDQCRRPLILYHWRWQATETSESFKWLHYRPSWASPEKRFKDSRQLRAQNSNIISYIVQILMCDATV